MALAALPRLRAAERRPNILLIIGGTWRAQAVPWAGDFDATAFNYTPLVILVGIIVAVWWAISAKNKYTGPVRTIETDELGRVVEEEPPTTEPPAGTAPAGTT